jgi:hypothetical protein
MITGPFAVFVASAVLNVAVFGEFQIGRDVPASDAYTSTMYLLAAQLFTR